MTGQLGKFHAPNEVIELLETYLDLARKMPFGSVAISLCGYPNMCAQDFAGDLFLELSQTESLHILHKRLTDSIDQWVFLPRNEDLDASYVVYNIANGPLCFDFICWL